MKLLFTGLKSSIITIQGCGTKKTSQTKLPV